MEYRSSTNWKQPRVELNQPEKQAKKSIRGKRLRKSKRKKKSKHTEIQKYRNIEIRSQGNKEN
jgi:hypothetical protein